MASSGAMEYMVRFQDEGYTMWIKTTMILECLKTQLDGFLEKETDAFHKTLKRKINLYQTECSQRPKCKVYSDELQQVKSFLNINRDLQEGLQVQWHNLEAVQAQQGLQLNALADRVGKLEGKHKELPAESITCHLRSLLDKFNQYFLTENVEPFDWVRQPFTNCSSNNLASELEDALIELSSDRTLQASFASKTLDEFWLSVVQEYPGLSKAAMDILTPFGSTYLCEKTFSSLAYIKNKYRCRLNSMEENLRVAVSSIDPRIDLLCSRKQAHPSH
ncbi:hypothetical protein NHX12_004692 [Muraenolepis orangiensis]|uniref:HAT C-terminal dimerisation domain-containing protein n=1 Tax=Muraenolepis orangiensis TaxID=630683 RepID=A0A9Q0DVZ4_9TELE|nr:hypothetical protein NHX12_004692 [Muraenolepis orangiensis]